MKTACFIPIKEHSERVRGKNFRMLCGRRLYEYILEHARKANCFDDIYVDTNSAEISGYAANQGFSVIERLEALAANEANGNDLLVYHRSIKPDYDFYFQLFATAPFLQSASIAACAEGLLSSNEYDSCFTATKNNAFYWFNDLPVNFRPEILPRSQDMTPVIEETTGMYGITAESLDRYRCRTGRKPYIHAVSKFEAVDINTEDDLRLAEYIGSVYWKMNGGGYESIVKFSSSASAVLREAA